MKDKLEKINLENVVSEGDLGLTNIELNISLRKQKDKENRKDFLIYMEYLQDKDKYVFKLYEEKE